MINFDELNKANAIVMKTVETIYPFEYSLLSEMYSDEFEKQHDIEGINVEKLLNNESVTWEQIGVNVGGVSAISTYLHKVGYEFAELLWISTYQEKEEVNIQEFVSVALSKLTDSVLRDEWVELLKDAAAAEDVKFWNIPENDEVYGEILIPWCANMTMRGVATYITRKGILNADIPLLNSKIAEHLNAIANTEKSENRKSAIAEILAECGLYMLSLSDYGCSPRFYGKCAAGTIVDEDVDYLYVFNDELRLVLNGLTPQVISVPLEETSENYFRIVEDIMAAVNAAYGHYLCGE